jgi:hypothetical protein
MIKWMIKAHPTQNRMARQACVEPRLTLFRRGQRSPAQKCPCDWVLRQGRSTIARLAGAPWS